MLFAFTYVQSTMPYKSQNSSRGWIVTCSELYLIDSCQLLTSDRIVSSISKTKKGVKG